MDCLSQIHLQRIHILRRVLSGHHAVQVHAPGRAHVIKNYFFKDLTHILFTVFPHNQYTTPKLLEKYRIGKLSQRSMPRVRQEGTILKTRREKRQNSIIKKPVQFPSQVKKLASQKGRKDEMKRSRMQQSKSKMKDSTMAKKPPTADPSQDEKSKRSKNFNQDQLSALKESKTPVKPTQSEHQLADEIKQQITIKRFDYGELQNNIQESTVNVSIKKYLHKSWGTLQEFVDEVMPVIKVPVLNVRQFGDLYFGESSNLEKYIFL